MQPSLSGTATVVAPSTNRIASIVASVCDLHRRPEHEHLPLPVRLASSAHRLHHLGRDVLAAQDLAAHYAGRLPDGPVVLLTARAHALDPLAIVAGTPCLPITEPGAPSWPVLGPALGALGIAPRGDVREILAAGTSVLGFAGDGTPHALRAGPFDRELVRAARASGRPVIPVAVRLRATRSETPEGLTAHVEFGPALDPTSFPDARSLGRAAAALIDALRREAAGLCS